jgi:ribosomal protein S4
MIKYASEIKKQQMAAGAALAAKRGERKKSSLKGASKQMAESMSEKQLKDFAKTKRKTFLLNLMHTTKPWRGVFPQ